MKYRAAKVKNTKTAVKNSRFRISLGMYKIMPIGQRSVLAYVSAESVKDILKDLNS